MKDEINVGNDVKLHIHTMKDYSIKKDRDEIGLDIRDLVELSRAINEIISYHAMKRIERD